MFPVKSHKVIIKDLHSITSNLTVLFNDGENDILYTGYNKYGNRLLAAIMFEDDETNFLRYIHVLVTDNQYYDFINKRKSLRTILEENESFFVVDKNYNNQEISVDLIALAEVPNDFLPLKNSFCPDFIRDYSFNYSANLKGNLADRHISIPDDLNSVNSKFTHFLRSSTNLANTFDLQNNIYVEGLAAGSVKINFKIELIPAKQLGLFQVPLKELSAFFNQYFNYVLSKLPGEKEDVFKAEVVESIEFKKLEESLSLLYKTQQITPTNIEHEIIDLIGYSLEELKGIEYNRSFDRIEFVNYSKNGTEVPIALIDDKFMPNVENKVFKSESLTKQDVVEHDKAPTKYKIQVYSFNTQSGNGSAYFRPSENKINKISIHLKGKTNYENTIITKSMDIGEMVEVSGVAMKVNNVIKEITIEL